jgi:iron complex transport system ATP-binding protein
MEFGNLSQGEQQKVLIARARMAAPFLILLDEPCAGLDPQARETFLSWLHAFGSGKKTPGLIYVTHHLEEILPIFRQTLILKEGRRMACGTTVDLLRPATIKKLYGLSVRVVKNKGRYWPICTQ